MTSGDVPDETAVLAFVERNRDAHAIREAFPFGALERLASANGWGDAADAGALITLLDLACRYDDASDDRGRTIYSGQDLRRQAAVVRALRGCEPTPAGDRAIAALLRASTFDRWYASPGGSPDIDKYDRDRDVEEAQDALALACVEALARSTAPDAHTALEAARAHRDERVRTAVDGVRPVAAKETPITRWFDRFRAISFYEWVPRLLAPERILQSCAEIQDGADAALRTTGWCAVRLPTCVLHPGCLPHGSRAVESLLDLTTEQAMAVVYGPSEDESLRGAPALRAALEKIDPSHAARSDDPHRDALLAAFASAGARPEWMTPTVVPVPGTLRSSDRTDELSRAFLDKVARMRRLLVLRPPAIVLEGGQRAMQDAFDALYLAVCDDLERRA
jgi:hypothetical protein